VTQRPTLAEPFVISQWWRNRRGEAIRVQLSTWKDCNLVDVRVWYSAEGKLKPGKGLCAQAKHLPQLASAFAKATAKARELGLIATDDDGCVE
jgi:hypothetical protein